MGEAARRKRLLGSKYGKKGIGQRPLIVLEWPMPDILDELDEKIGGVDDYIYEDCFFIVAFCGHERTFLIARPVVTTTMFNTEVLHIDPKPWMLKDWKQHHRWVNRFILERPEQMIINADESGPLAKEQSTRLFLEMPVIGKQESIHARGGDST
jgi:hypothetical protein